MEGADSQCAQLAHHAKPFRRREAQIESLSGAVRLLEGVKSTDRDRPHEDIIIRPNGKTAYPSSSMGIRLSVSMPSALWLTAARPYSNPFSNA